MESQCLSQTFPLDLATWKHCPTNHIWQRTSWDGDGPALAEYYQGWNRQTEWLQTRFREYAFYVLRVLILWFWHLSYSGVTCTLVAHFRRIANYLVTTFCTVAVHKIHITMSRVYWERRAYRQILNNNSPVTDRHRLFQSCIRWSTGLVSVMVVRASFWSFICYRLWCLLGYWISYVCFYWICLLWPVHIYANTFTVISRSKCEKEAAKVQKKKKKDNKFMPYLVWVFPNKR